MTSQNQQSLKPGEINLNLLPIDWPLTPLGAKKDPYVSGWQNKPFSVKEIEEEIIEGSCKAIGLLGGPVYNHPYGLVWVDVDGPSIYPLVEELSGKSFKNALPDTLTILSGKTGRERKLYQLPRDKHKHFVRNKYVFHSEVDKEKLEILWKRHQGVLMGLHPETDGYYTAPNQGFEWVERLAELPDWLLQGIINKNVKQGVPNTERTRIVGPGFAINAEISVERDMKLASEAMWAMPPEAADDYDIWITVGQSLHQLDESLLAEWDEWSKQSSKYREGECQRRWNSFSRDGGRGLGSLIHVAQQHGFRFSEDYKSLPVDDQTLEHSAQILQKLEEDMTSRTVADPQPSMQNLDNGPVKKKKRGKEQQSKNRPSNEVADILINMYNGNLRFSQAQGVFFLYNEKRGVWSQLSDFEIKNEVRDKFCLLADGFLPNGFTTNLINDVIEQLRMSLIFDDWYDRNDHLLFTNGILSLETKQLLPFNREMYITQQLPYDYDPGATCEPIIKWLKGTQDGNWGRVQVLRAWLRSVLLSCSDIQKFVEIVGPGKSGKSTYANLAHALVGDENAMISSLEHLEKNRFETANLYKKKLLLFNDVERYGGSVSVLKAITGRDLIRNERKFQSGSHKPFKFNGLVMITANEPIQTTDPTSGLARRRLTIPFDRPFKGSAAEQKTLIDMDDNGNPFGIFASMLPGLVNWLLDMPESDMREYLMETNAKVPFFARHHREQILKSNQIMDWMEHCLVFAPGASASIGLAKYAAQGSSNTYAHADSWLYASYCEFTRSSNSNLLGRSRFETLLMDVCVHQLNLNVYKKKETRGLRVINVACRTSDPMYKDYPSIVEVGLNKEKWKEQYGDVLENKKDETIDIQEEHF